VIDGADRRQVQDDSEACPRRRATDERRIAQIPVEPGRLDWFSILCRMQGTALSPTAGEGEI
jgi:hypothetical protein